MQYNVSEPQSLRSVMLRLAMSGLLTALAIAVTLAASRTVDSSASGRRPAATVAPTLSVPPSSGTGQTPQRTG
jgi:hypothetical protein